MTDEEWKLTLTICNQVLGEGNSQQSKSCSWCAWTTFDRLETSVFYWNAGIPSIDCLEENYVNEGSWTQPFLYSSIAHFIIPKNVYWEEVNNGEFINGTIQQDIYELSRVLDNNHVEHQMSEYWLEIKLF